MIMKGKQTLEEKNNKHDKTKYDTQNVNVSTQSDLKKSSKQECTSHLVLQALLQTLPLNQAEWPMKMLLGVMEKFGRMPRSGWSIVTQHYCAKFKIKWSELELKRMASTAIVDHNGKRCSGLKYKSDPVKRSKVVEQITNSGMTIKENSMMIETKRIFLECFNSTRKASVEKFIRTQKIASELVDRTKLYYINKSLKEQLDVYQPSTMTDIAKLIQASQMCYQKVTRREKKASSWKTNIQGKIDKLESSINRIKVYETEDKVPPKDKSSLYKIFRSVGVTWGKKDANNNVISLLEEKVEIYKKKLDMYAKRIEFRKANRSFELYRGSFYRNLTDTKIQCDVPVEDIQAFWSTMWTKPDKKESEFKQYLLDYSPLDRDKHTFISEEEFSNLIQYLPNWKAPGVDGIYNYFIKYLPTIHSHLYNVVSKICLEGKIQDEWFYTGTTYLIPKGTPEKGSDFRPITCMSNLYKLTTKCVTTLIQLEVEERNILSENQLGTVRFVQGAKEQAMINLAVNKANANDLKTVWVDVKKAFDSVDHEYFISCIESYKFQPWIVNFLKGLITNWRIDIKYEKESILKKKIERGILQGDSLSPLMFVLCIDPLSKRLNNKYPLVEVETDNEKGSYSTNHLLFIDDLKLMAKSAETCKSMLDETLEFFKCVGLEVNKKKSATNFAECADTALLLTGTEGYKYLGVVETARSEADNKTLKSIKECILKRVQTLCSTKLNGKNLFRAINEHAVSLINYYVGIIDVSPEDCKDIDKEIRKILMINGMHKQPSSLERLYLPREELGRGLQNVEHRYETILLQLMTSFEKSLSYSTRRRAILQIEEKLKSSLYLIKSYIKVKYEIANANVTLELLKEHQKLSLYNNIKNKTLHEKLYSTVNNPVFSLSNSSVWLKKGNISPRDEAALCFVQDRNVFLGESKMCPHCNQKRKTVDHLATRCERMLAFDYTRRHNEVVRCILAKLCLTYGLRNSKKIRNHSIQEIISNKKVTIKVDTRIPTDVKIDANKPDIYIFDKEKKQITLVEIGITSIENLQSVELEKTRKYDLLAKELGLINQCKVKIIPYVMTWDGLVTKYHKQYVKELGLDAKIEAYIQSRVIKKTLESISLEYRRGLMEGGSGVEDTTSIVQRLDATESEKAI